LRPSSTAATTRQVTKVSGNHIPGWQELDTGPQSIGYELTGPGRTLVIGGGGGRDIDAALAAGQKQVDVIELNEGIRKVVDEDLAKLSGSLLAARDRHYGVIHMGFAFSAPFRLSKELPRCRSSERVWRRALNPAP
jgi:hypothetical protein